MTHAFTSVVRERHGTSILSVELGVHPRLLRQLSNLMLFPSTSHGCGQCPSSAEETRYSTSPWIQARLGCPRTALAGSALYYFLNISSFCPSSELEDGLEVL